MSPSFSEARDLGLPVSLAWDANPESTVIGYFVYVGTSPGQYSQSFDVGNNTTYVFSGGTAGQQYYFSVAAYVSGYVQGLRSTEVSAVVEFDPNGGSGGGSSGGGGGGGGGGGSTGGGGGSVSSPNLSTGSVSGPTSNSGPAVSGPGVVLQPAVVSGTALTLQWAAVGGLPVLEYIIEAGSGPGLSNIYNGTVGLSNLVSATIGPGTYYVRVRARTGSTSTVTSNEISFSAGLEGISGCTAPPPTPASVDARVLSGTASVSWQPVAGATSYVVAAGSSSGLSDVFYGNVGNSASVSAPVEAGFTAYVRVIAVNACGQSAASSDVFMQ